MALTVVSGNVAITQDQRTLSWTIPTLAVGDVVVVAAVTWDQANTLNPPSGTGLTFTQRLAANAASHTRVYIWTAVASSAGSSVVVTCSVLAASNSIHNGTLYVCPTADGYSLAATPNTATSTTGSSASLSGASGNLGIVAVGDWSGGSGASRAWLASAVEDMYQFSSTDSTQYGAHCDLTGATTSVGLSTPTGASFTTGAIEILKSGGGGPALPPILVQPPRRF
ncbi:hypothetical protein GON03_18950 [Nocardioides sp. MAH-18]|uniref:Uncharacterized protein n=1 Tax=Nocardioides agri TaxID=2682843 RepID=A0A6L6XV50_9ACTN|nr:MULTISPECIES: hypothetical protein [unclassified Nocardioides]MBA2952095.1 hypothetical protein [Nocardioides sp. CGMCC 1.13656]MVQ51264.1 hypothetical protein [Nocardioides sp. MAH-18]